MTLSELITQSRLLSRTTSNVSDATVTSWLNEAQKQFAKDVDGIDCEYYLALAPAFDIATNVGFSFIITGGAYAGTHSIVFTTNENNLSGTTTASRLQTVMRTITTDSSLTVTWDSTTKKFSITPTGATDMEVAVLSGYHDFGTPCLGIKTVSSSVFTGDAVSPSHNSICTYEATLPDDYLKILYVDYDGTTLYQTDDRNFDDIQYNGTPCEYAIRGRNIRLFPTPSSNGTVHIRYKALPTALSGGSDESTIPKHYHSALYSYAAAKLAESNFEFDVSDRQLRNYYTDVRRYTQERANDNSKMDFNSPTYSKHTFYGQY